MRSHARLIYENVEKALLGDIDAVGTTIWESTIQPAARAYDVLKAARERRGALDIDVPEQVVVLNDDKTRVDSVVLRAPHRAPIDRRVYGAGKRCCRHRARGGEPGLYVSSA